MKSKKTTKSLYQILSTQVKSKIKQETRQQLDLCRTVRRLRLQKQLSGAELCRRAGDLDPKTLTALEMGRIKNPSVKTLQSLARGLGVTVATLFTAAETETDGNFFVGTQRGAFQMDFPSWGIKVISFTPLIKDFFCGKLIIGPKKKLTHTFLAHSKPFFLSTLIGRVDITVEDKKQTLKEGENLFFNGVLKHEFVNPLQRESVLLMITAPSFL
ncbi:MAG: helix-turn-helix domain-containing protein [Candidatus Omnitrophica bacterium]|nr:helix-turn-helix domain-containing protein [Candidatus Omnitrophota bacterium]